MDKYPTAIECYFSQGKKVIVYIVSEACRNSATDYINDARARFPYGDAIIEVMGTLNLENRTVIHYYRAQSGY